MKISTKNKIWNVPYHKKSTNQKIDDRNWACVFHLEMNDVLMYRVTPLKWDKL